LSHQSSEQQDIIKLKLTAIFRYLQALDQLRNPVERNIEDQLWKLWLRDLPNHPAVQRGMVSSNSEESEDYLLKVRRPRLTEAPRPPQELFEWLEDGWEKVDGVVRIREERILKDDEGKDVMIRFQDDTERVKVYQKWVEKRNRWVESEKPARQAMDIFERLYALHSWIERESEQVELVIGEGILNWPRKDGTDIYHPILLQRVQLLFDPSIPEFTIMNTGNPPELYSALFRSINEVPGQLLSESIQDLEKNQYHPLGGEETTQFLKEFVLRLSPIHGKFIEKKDDSISLMAPTIRRDPVIFLRKRNLGFAAALEAILKDIQERNIFPESLVNMIGINTERDHGSQKENSYSFDVNGEDEHVLLCKEANAEQLEIARRLEKYGSVLVQGPPGTGKTHTIANLLGHLLAQGKSVLVTSHTSKALRVLRDKVIEPLQPLCVSVLDNDTESQRQLESSVDAITERLSSLDADNLEREANSLMKQRKDLLRELRETREKLKQARQDEYRKIILAGEEYDPSQAARYVVENQEKDSWIPSPVAFGEPLPLSHEELVELYYTNTAWTGEEERELGNTFPNTQELLHPSDFERLVQERARLAEQNLGYRTDLWQEMPPDVLPDHLLDLMNRLKQAVQPLLDESEWRMRVFFAGFEGGTEQKIWEELIEEINETYNFHKKIKSKLLRYNIDISYMLCNEETIYLFDKIISYLEKRGKLGLLKLLVNPSWKKIIKNVKVDGASPAKKEHFEALSDYIRLEVARTKLISRWERQITSIGGPAVNELGREPEEVGRYFAEQISQCLNWYQKIWIPLESEIRRFGLQWDVLIQEIPLKMVAHSELIRIREIVLDKLPLIVQSQCNRLKWSSIEKQLNDLRETLKTALSRAGESDVVNRLYEAVKELDVEGYRTAYENLIALLNKVPLFERRKKLIEILERSAPVWAEQIRNREGIHGRGNLPGNPDSAWLWRQLHDELERRSKVSMEELQDKIVYLSEKLRQLTGILVEKKAWTAQIRKTSLEQRQALQGWKSITKKIGKGTGKRVPYLLAEARRLMPICQTAVPVWIMPISRVVENFDPRRNQFDVLIIDEASQSDVMALTVFYLAKQVVVVGDDQQVSPEAIGQNYDQIRQLIEIHLKGIPHSALFDPINSVYDLAKVFFPGIVQLREHFRCVPEIIQFSNYLSYDGRILPLRDPSNVKRRPFTVAYRIESAVSDSKVNEQEALHVASLLVAASMQPEYADATFGVISMVGEEQALRIEALLRKHMSPTEFKRRAIRCGTSAQFQGDERDVIFLSIVDTPKGDGPLVKRVDDRFKKRFNVAASRARDQMWVVYSLDPELDLKEDDLRRKLILHAKNPYALSEIISELEKQAESEFEKLVMQRLVQAGYRVIPQWRVGAYRIDMVVEGGGKRLAVECDGDKWHTFDQIGYDMARQALLERLGWRFVRIRGSEFFRNPEKAMQPVFEKLKKLDIPPEGFGIQNNKSIDGEELKERIIRKADELRRKWAGMK